MRKILLLETHLHALSINVVFVKAKKTGKLRIYSLQCVGAAQRHITESVCLGIPFKALDDKLFLIVIYRNNLLPFHAACHVQENLF